MAELPDEVMPGRIITSEWINQLLAKVGELNAQVQQLSGSIPSGSVTVPNVFGKPLSEARQIITLPALQLALGNVFDSNGASVNPNVADSFSLTVLGQYPVPGAKAVPGSAVNLLVAGTSDSAAPQGPLIPNISGFSKVKTPVGELVDIIGTNFDSAKAKNTVKFKNATAEVLVATIMSLTVRVPEGITGVPLSGTTEVPVIVSVVTPGGEDTADYVVVPSLGAGPPPSIASFVPTIPVVNSPVTINGANFSPDFQQNIIHFDTHTVTSSSAKINQLIVTVPNAVIPSTGQKAVTVKVEVNTGNGPPKMSNPVQVLMQRG